MSSTAKRVLKRVPRRSSEKAVSRRCLERPSESATSQACAQNRTQRRDLPISQRRHSLKSDQNPPKLEEWRSCPIGSPESLFYPLPFEPPVAGERPCSSSERLAHSLSTHAANAQLCRNNLEHPRLDKHVRFAKTFACYRGHLGPSGLKWQKESEMSSWEYMPLDQFAAYFF